ncbi:MAG: molybdopterin-guanine dinucleotide biosynthesis protein B [Gammaproteobacteria bacterium]|nr:molybdopterin-guanine dinucleotide biosynthesis protein B [Gammaproteobacteria bacterium]
MAPIEYPIPLMGFAAFSGTGKTTLLARLLPALRAHGLRIAVVKHAHHRFDIDHPGKDSHTLRKAGAERILVASRHRMALIVEQPERRDDVYLADALAMMDPRGLDLVLVEGFKHEAFPKIELHRPALGKPLLYPYDPTIVAIATDEEAPPAGHGIPHLPLNEPGDIAVFIIAHLGLTPRAPSTNPRA